MAAVVAEVVVGVVSVLVRGVSAIVVLALVVGVAVVTNGRWGEWTLAGCVLSWRLRRAWLLCWLQMHSHGFTADVLLRTRVLRVAAMVATAESRDRW